MIRRCNKTLRSGPLHPSIKIGGVSMGQCENEALPEMVVCEYHANPEAVRMVVTSMAKRLEAR